MPPQIRLILGNQVPVRPFACALAQLASRVSDPWMGQVPPRSTYYAAIVRVLSRTHLRHGWAWCTLAHYLSVH